MQYIKFTFLSLFIIYFGNNFFSPFHTIMLDFLDYISPTNLNDDGYLTTMQLCEKYKYSCEEHFLETSDGYILAIHRIMGKTKGPKISKKAPTVFVSHGIFSASTPFILDGEKSLGGILSDNGLDVWLGNFRGNRYSRNHTTLNPEYSTFWDFTNLDMAINDLPATIDYILTKVGKKSVHFVGYSMSGYLISGILAYKPEFNNKIQSLTYVASSSAFKNFNSGIINTGLAFVKPLSYFYGSLIKPFEYSPYTKSHIRTSYRYFNKNSIFFKMIWSAYEEIFGADNDNSNKDRFPYYVSHFFNGASFNQIMHIYQSTCLRKAKFYDHGPKRNLIIYGQETSPSLDHAISKAPKLFIYGSHDRVIPKEAVLEGAAKMTNVKKIVEVEGFNHWHFMFSRNMKPKVYDIVTEFIKNHN